MADGTTELLCVRHEGAISIGRDPSCHVVLPSPDVSRRHLMVEAIDGGYRVTDRSANGTMVARQLVRGTSLEVASGAPLRVGPYVVRLGTVPELPLLPAQVVTRPGRPAKARPDLGGAEAERTPASQPDRLTRPVTSLRPFNRPPANVAANGLATRRVKVQRGGPSPRMHPGPAQSQWTKAVSRAREPGGATEAGDESGLTPAFGPVAGLLADEEVMRVMVRRPDAIFVERGNALERTSLAFESAEALNAWTRRLLRSVGEDSSSQDLIVQARLRDGTELTAVLPPLAQGSPSITIERMKKLPRIEDLARSLPTPICTWLRESLAERHAILVSSPARHERAALVNALVSGFDQSEQVAIVEREGMLDFDVAGWTRLLRGQALTPYPQLLRAALRLRADRLVVTDLAGPEAAELLAGIQLGQRGVTASICAQSAEDAIAHLRALTQMGGAGPAPDPGILRGFRWVVHVERGASNALQLDVARIAEPDDAGNIRLRRPFGKAESAPRDAQSRDA